jgi:hypothetical protein
MAEPLIQGNIICSQPHDSSISRENRKDHKTILLLEPYAPFCGDSGLIG